MFRLWNQSWKFFLLVLIIFYSTQGLKLLSEAEIKERWSFASMVGAWVDEIIIAFTHANAQSISIYKSITFCISNSNGESHATWLIQGLQLLHIHIANPYWPGLQGMFLAVFLYEILRKPWKLLDVLLSFIKNFIILFIFNSLFWNLIYNF